MAELETIESGLYTSIQDQGRLDYLSYGVPTSGAMDQKSAIRANQIIGNAPNSPVIEITQIGPKLYFSKSSLIGIAGAEIEAILNGQRIPNNHPVIVPDKSTMHLKRTQNGARSYLAIYGLESEKVMGSFAQYEGITSEPKFKVGDKLSYKIYSNIDHQLPLDHPSLEIKDRLSLFRGPEFDLLEQAHVKKLKTAPFTIGANNRMAYYLKEGLGSHGHDILTQPVRPGTIQWTPGGSLILLMRDAQVTGGYPRILQITKESIDHLAQLNTGNQVRFSIIDCP